MRIAVPSPRVQSRAQAGEAEQFTLALFVILFVGMVIGLFLLLYRPQPGPAPQEKPNVAEKVEPPAPPRDVRPARDHGAAGASGASEKVEDAAADATDTSAEGVVSGRVRVAGGEDPAPGVQIVLRPEAPASEEKLQDRFKAPQVREGDHLGTAQEDGSYRVVGLEPGDYRVFALGGATDFVSIPPSSGMRLKIPQDLAPQSLDVEVVRGGVISGRVVEEDGKPVPAARVSAPSRDFFSSVFDPDTGFSGIPEATAAPDGTFRIAGLPLEGKYLLLTEAKDKATSLSDEIAFEDGQREVEVSIVLLEGSAVSGVVLSPDGERRPGAKVTISPAEAREVFFVASIRESTTDAAGAFDLKHLPASRYRISAEAAGARPTVQDLECDGKTPVMGIVLKLEAAAAQGDSSSVMGRVLDDLGQGLEGVSLQLAGFTPGRGAFSATTTSKAGGEFAFEGVSQGIFNLAVNHEGYAPFLRQGVGPGIGPIEVVLQRVARIRGVVRSRSTGDPVAEADVRLSFIDQGVSGLTQLMAGQIMGEVPSAKTAADGTFAIEKVQPGRLRVRAEASGLGPGYSREIEVKPGEEMADLEVALSQGGVVRGRVLGPDSRPVAGAAVRAHEVAANALENQMRRMLPTLLGGETWPGVRSLEDGSFEVDHLAEGRLSLTATHPDYAPSADIEVILALDEKKEGIQLKLQRFARIKVTAREKDKPLEGLMVQLIGTGPMKMGTLDKAGAFAFDGVGPGDYMVQLMDMAKMVSGQGLGLRQQVVSIAEGQTVDVEFVFGTGARVHGKIEGDVPGPMGMVVLRRDERPGPEEADAGDFMAGIRAARSNIGMSFITPDKTYSIPDVPDGEYILEIPRMNLDFAKMAQAPPEQQKPLFSDKVKIEHGRHLEKDIVLPQAH